MVLAVSADLTDNTGTQVSLYNKVVNYNWRCPDRAGLLARVIQRVISTFRPTVNPGSQDQGLDVTFRSVGKRLADCARWVQRITSSMAACYRWAEIDESNHQLTGTLPE